jgi:hypothetical protein
VLALTILRRAGVGGHLATVMMVMRIQKTYVSNRKVHIEVYQNPPPEARIFHNDYLT